MVTTMYGIAQCDTVKKARHWLAQRGVTLAFHDYKKQGVPEVLLTQWVATHGWEALLNRRGTTWRGLDEATRAAVADPSHALALMVRHASVIKRPVVVWPDGVVTVGFDEAVFAAQCPT